MLRADQLPSSESTSTLDGRVAIVTGASSGLGRRFAKVLSAHGASVVVAARRSERLHELVATLGSDRALAVPADVTDPADVARVVAMAKARFGRIDVLVNNAGIVDNAPAEALELEEFRRVVEVDLVAVFGCCRAVVGAMRAGGGGSIVNVASVMGLVGSGRLRCSSYAASKAGVVNLTRDLATQWARHHVRVNAIAPGFFESEMTADLVADPRGRSWLEERIPMGRIGGAEELDGPLLFLAGDASSYVTGQTIVVDGGWTSL